MSGTPLALDMMRLYRHPHVITGGGTGVTGVVSKGKSVASRPASNRGDVENGKVDPRADTAVTPEDFERSEITEVSGEFGTV